MSKDKKEICCELFDIQKWIPEFLIDDVKRKALCFREALMVCLKSEPARDSKPIGGYCILVESIGPQSHELLVHVQSSMFVDGHFGGSKVISSATSKFHCLEEKRTELLEFNESLTWTLALGLINVLYSRFVYEDDGLHERTVYIGSEDNFYHVKLIRSCPSDERAETKDLSCRYNSKFISEGVNILLMRYLAIINYEGMLSFDSITVDGELTTSNYTCTRAEHMEIDGHYLSVYSIERKIHGEDETVHTIKTYLTPQGKILRHNWLDVPYILKLNPLVDPKTTSKTIRITTPLRDRWKEDIEMFSKYLDVKYSNIAEQTEYLADHPEVKQLIADYTQTLLVGNEFLNGINILPILLRQHFKAFAKCPKSWETSSLEENSHVDIQSQLARGKSDVSCSICGFCIDCHALPESRSRSSAEECPDAISSSDSGRSVHSKVSDLPVTPDKQEKDETSTSKTSTSSKESKEERCKPNVIPQLKRTCDQCQAIVRTCDGREPFSKCPGCLKVFQICTKCSIIDKILGRLKIGDTDVDGV